MSYDEINNLHDFNKYKDSLKSFFKQIDDLFIFVEGMNCDEENCLTYAPGLCSSKIYFYYLDNKDYGNAIDFLKEEIIYYNEKYDTVPSFLMMRVEEYKKLKNKLENKIVYLNNEFAESLMDNGELDEAVLLCLENIGSKEFDSIDSLVEFKEVLRSYGNLARIYHYKREFENEWDILKVLDDENIFCYGNSLENLEYYFANGKFIHDYLPMELKIISHGSV